MKNSTLLFFLFLSFALPAQQPIRPILCGNEIFSDMVRDRYPALDAGIRQTFNDALRAPAQRSNEPLTVGVVVHVIWNAPEENLHDSIILNQLEILNNDYNRRNADTVNLRSVFHAEAGNANIRFELVELIRVHTDQLFEVDLFGTNLLAEVKHTSEGGSDGWDPESYINIWITKIQPIQLGGIEIGQILGFAFPPVGLDHWPDGSSSPTPGEDGVVLDYRIIGSNNPNTVLIPDGSGDILIAKGRSASHEVGHYLGLRHIWGDGGLFGPNDCQQSDGIDDTPFADSQSAFDCDKTKNSCSQVESHYNNNVPDLIENFMDYASDDCMNMFTKGQVSLMRNVLLGPRSGLLNVMSSVENISDNPAFRISPNPVSNQFVVDFYTADQTEIAIRVSDMSGQLTIANIKEQYLPGHHQVSVNVNGFTPGIYFVEMRMHKGVHVEKVVVK